MTDTEIRAAAASRLETLVSPGEVSDWFRVPDHGVIGRAADGSYFVECFLILSPAWLREREQIEKGEANVSE